jgi:hypothetical protein
MITGTAKNLEAERVSEKEPFLIQGRQVDGFFKFTIDKLGAARARAAAPLNNYLKKVAAEEQRRRDEEARKLREQQEAERAAAALLEKAKLDEAAATMADQAKITAQAANKAQQAAEAKPAAMAQSRGESGSLASLRTVWVGELVSVEELELDIIRHHLDPAALQKAINSYVRAGGRKLPGAKIYEKSETVVR